MTQNWQLPPDYVTGYLDACKKAATDDEAFANFRQDPHINTVIENTPKWWSDQAMEKMGITPTMVRYKYILHLLETLYHERILWDADIVEIGGGYGGQCKVISDLYPYARYTIYDLPEVIELQKRFLEHYTVSYKTSFDSEKYTIGISWCAWSELSYDLRVEYAEKVISKCDHFFICSNYNKAEDLEILSKYFTGIKEYNDELVQNVIYA